MGVFGKGKNTKVRATEKLIQLLTGSTENPGRRIESRSEKPLIVLRDSKRRALEFEETEATLLMRDNLRRINALLERTWIDIYLPDAELRELAPHKTPLYPHL